MIDIKRIQVSWVPRMYEFNSGSEVTGYVTVVHDGAEHFLRFTVHGIDEDNKRKDVYVDIDPPTPNKDQSFVALFDLEPDGEEDGYAVARSTGWMTWEPVEGGIRILQDDWNALVKAVGGHAWDVVDNARIAARIAWDNTWKVEQEVEVDA